MADPDDLQKAVDLVTESTEENQDKNFEEALRICDTHENRFNEATKEDRNKNFEEDRAFNESEIEHFNHAIKLEDYCDKGNEKIENKCEDKQYLEKEEQYELENTLCKNEISKAVVYCIVAVKEDTSENYEKALNLYEKGIFCILRALDYEVLSEEREEIMRNKMKQYEERAEKIQRYLWKLKRKELENDSEFDTKSDKEEQKDIRCCGIC